VSDLGKLVIFVIFLTNTVALQLDNLKLTIFFIATRVA